MDNLMVLSTQQQRKQQQHQHQHQHHKHRHHHHHQQQQQNRTAKQERHSDDFGAKEPRPSENVLRLKKVYLDTSILAGPCYDSGNNKITKQQ